jgi:fatty acid desaturase
LERNLERNIIKISFITQEYPKMEKAVWKDYSLRGDQEDATLLTEESFEDQVEQAWFSANIDRKTFKKLIKRSDGAARKDFALWFGLLLLSGVAAYLSWGTALAFVFFGIYGTLYSVADHRHHELSHGTPFKTRWANDVLFHLCAFMTLREGFYYRWSHTRHHSHTMLVGKDPEIAATRPPNILGLISDLFFIQDGIGLVKRLVQNATGQINNDGRHFIPENEMWKVIWAARVYLMVVTLVFVSCLLSWSILPAMFVFLPRFYGGFLSQVFNLTQHAGLAEDVYDHRLNTRTVIMNPVFSFLYANMNYHVEHHMFPMVPYYRLPELHELIKDQIPQPCNGLWEAYQEIIPALVRQQNDPSWEIQKLPFKKESIEAAAA